MKRFRKNRNKVKTEKKKKEIPEKQSLETLKA
jgi:hypothetical protein